MDDSSATTTFFRQRRDLFVITSLLLVVQFAEHIKSEKLGFGGIEIELESPRLLLWAIWALWAYWFLRFYQAYRATGGWNVVRQTYQGRVDERIKHKFLMLAEEETLELVTGPQSSGSLPADPRIDSQGYEKSGAAWFGWTPIVLNPGTNTLGELPRRKTEIPASYVRWTKFKAILFVAVNRIEISEHLFPSRTR